ncbi:hypothetical protein WA026_017653 [Henosepilachna vigintioctopunctata]|uniref:Uncharacterized protein n=1 Tax=Henosepilachna vigintioctopunctata TaxID=420089 RepID=A0AAW1U9G2_9CUCU
MNFTEFLTRPTLENRQSWDIQEKLMNLTAKIVDMREKLDRVNSRYSCLTGELSNQYEYVVKLTRIGEKLDEQENALKRQVIEAAKKMISRLCAPLDENKHNIIEDYRNRDRSSLYENCFIKQRQSG